MNTTPLPPHPTDRRTFVRTAAACAGLSLLPACSRQPATHPSRSDTVPATSPPNPGASPPARTPIAPPNRETAIASVQALAGANVARCHHCAQSCFLALDDVFGFNQPAILKALTPLPGIAERGETCGAVTGSLLALGLVFGRDQIEDWTTWRASLIPARTFCDRFVAEFGSTMCADIVERLTGHRLDLYQPADLARFQTAGATAATTRVVRHAVSIAADLILDSSKS